MKHFKTILTALFLGLMLFSNAQENYRGKTKGKVINPGPKMPSVTLAIGLGNTMPSSSAKDAYLVNSSGVSADVSIPLTSFRKGWDGWPKTTLGINIGGQYNFGGSGNPSAALPNAFPIFGSTSSSVSPKGLDPKSPGFRMGVGPQVNFNLGKFTISPMVLVEYFSMTQKELSAVQTTEYNGQTYQKDLWTMPETKTSGLAFTPKVRVHYMITQSFGLFADASYILGPKVETQISTLVPSGPPNQAGTYDAVFIENGTYVKGETKSTSYSALGFNVGLSYSFKPRKGWNGATKSASDDIYKGWNGVTKSDDKGWNGVVNNESTFVTRKNGVSLPSLVKITIKYSGEKTNEGTPIVVGNSVTGTISDMPKGTKIKISQSYTGDEGSTVTDEKGNFSILLNHDTVHIIYVNDEEYGSIKIEGVDKDLNSDTSRKGWDGTVKR